MSKVKMTQKNKGTQRGKSGSKNWFVEQQQKQAVPKSQIPAEEKTESYKSLETLPIVKVQMKSNREEEHFKAAYQFALKSSDPKSSEVMTVHLDMQDEIHFNMEQDEAFKSAWKKGELMLLIAFPKNWKTMTIEADPDMEDEDEDMSFETDEDKFDYLYETGMSVYEG